MVLVDTSVWIEIFRDKTGNAAKSFKETMASENCVLSRFNQLELLQGALESGPGGGTLGRGDIVLTIFPEEVGHLVAPAGALGRGSHRLSCDLHDDGVGVQLGELAKGNPGALGHGRCETQFVPLSIGGHPFPSNRVAIGKELHTFFLRSALGHGARLALLTGFLVGTLRGDTPERSAILITLCIGYFTFLLSEIALLHSRLYHARSISRKLES